MKSAILELCPHGLAARTLVRDGETKEIVCVTQVKIEIGKQADFYSYEFTILTTEGKLKTSEMVVCLPGDCVTLTLCNCLGGS